MVCCVPLIFIDAAARSDVRQQRYSKEIHPQTLCVTTTGPFEHPSPYARVIMPLKAYVFKLCVKFYIICVR